MPTLEDDPGWWSRIPSGGWGPNWTTLAPPRGPGLKVSLKPWPFGLGAAEAREARTATRRRRREA